MLFPVFWCFSGLHIILTLKHFRTNVAPLSAITNAQKNRRWFQVAKKKPNCCHWIPLNVTHRAFKESPKEGIYLQGCKHTRCLGGTCLGNWGKWRGLLLIPSPTFHTDRRASPLSCFSLKHTREAWDYVLKERVFNERRRGSKQPPPPPPWRLPAVSFLVAPDNPSKRRLATTGGAEETNTFLMKDCDVCRCQPPHPTPPFSKQSSGDSDRWKWKGFFCSMHFSEQRVAQRAESWIEEFLDCVPQQEIPLNIIAHDELSKEKKHNKRSTIN